MISPFDDYCLHQTPDYLRVPGTTDRNFYDRYFFNGYTTDGKVFFAAALGVYPHLNIMDAGFAVRIGDRQYNLHTSRHLHMERMDTQVGPIRVEVVEPLKVLRVIVDDSEYGISADITITGRHAPIEEPRNTRRNGPRIVQDITRMTQLGRWSGWIKAGGQTITLNEANTLGTRDRSWGVRPVGASDSQATVPTAPPQFYWLWSPTSFDDGSFFFHSNEDAVGRAWNTRAVWCQDGDGEADFHHLNGEADVRWKQGTRHAQSATIKLSDDFGKAAGSVEFAPLYEFQMMGLGYTHPKWGHGQLHGELTVEREDIDQHGTHHILGDGRIGSAHDWQVPRDRNGGALDRSFIRDKDLDGI